MVVFTQLLSDGRLTYMNESSNSLMPRFVREADKGSAQEG